MTFLLSEKVNLPYSNCPPGDYIGPDSFFFALRRFFNALLEANHEALYGLPEDMAARLYL